MNSDFGEGISGASRGVVGGGPQVADPVLMLREVRKRYKGPRGGEVSVLGPVDVSLREGEFVAIVGASGCGKSTLLRVAAGLVPPSNGTVHRANEEASFVFQDHALLPWRTVAKNCALPLELAGVPRGERRERVQEVLRFVHLENWGQFYPYQLSGGMKMRAALARALVADAAIVYFDEPFSATDELNREGLNEYLSNLWLGRRFAALFVTHSISEAVFLAQRVLVMSTSPGTILGEVQVPFEYPRSLSIRTTDEFVHVERKVTSYLRGNMGFEEEPRVVGPAPGPAAGGAAHHTDRDQGSGDDTASSRTT